MGRGGASVQFLDGEALNSWTVVRYAWDKTFDF